MRQWQGMETFRYAHRGLHDGKVPENSLAAFRAAADRGFGAELDVHLTRDGRLAVIHDSELLRVCGRVGVVEELTAAELAGYTLCGTSEHIPFLEEVIPLFAGKGSLLVELKTRKGNYAALTQATCAALEGSGVTFCMESFDPLVLVWLRRHRSHIIRGQLSQDFSQAPSGYGRLADEGLTRLWTNCLTAPDFVAYRFTDREQPALRRWAQRKDASLFYWTIRNPESLRAAEAENACGIFEAFIPESPRKGELI